MRTARAEPAERGSLDIHPAVLRKIIEHAADGVPGTLRNDQSCGLGPGRSRQSAADAAEATRFQRHRLAFNGPEQGRTGPKVWSSR